MQQTTESLQGSSTERGKRVVDVPESAEKKSHIAANVSGERLAGVSKRTTSRTMPQGAVAIRYELRGAANAFFDRKSKERQREEVDLR
jgi:hypothetical protein